MLNGSEDARRRADAIFAKNSRRVPDMVERQRLLQQRETEKLLRLRSLRLANEATDLGARRSVSGRVSRTRVRQKG